MIEKSVSVNAFGCNPSFGSERGLGWIWVKELSKKYKVVCYTELDSKSEIERNNFHKNIEFVYINVSKLGHRIIYNQGNYFGYVFYFYYQWVVFFISLTKPRTDFYHHLNMIGYRVTGLFWLTAFIKSSKSIWGPIGGTNIIPFCTYYRYGYSELLKSTIKNIINFINLLAPNVLIANFFYGRRIFVHRNFMTSLMRAKNFYPETFIRDFSNENKLRDIDFVIVGKIVPRKNHILALDAIRLAGFKTKSIYIIGDGPQKKIIEDYCKKNSFNVKFTGNIERNDVVKLLSRSKVLINASVDEGTSHAVIEGLGQNCKIAGFRIGGHVGFQSEFLEKVSFFDSYRTLQRNLAKSIVRSYNSKFKPINNIFSVSNFSDIYYR